MALTATRWPSVKPVTVEPSAWMTPTASCPRVRSWRSPIAPLTVWESEVQTMAAVVFTTASLGPGTGTGFSMIPTLPIPRITNARIARSLLPASGWAREVGPRGVESVEERGDSGQHDDEQEHSEDKSPHRRVAGRRVGRERVHPRDGGTDHEPIEVQRHRIAQDRDCAEPEEEQQGFERLEGEGERVAAVPVVHDPESDDHSQHSHEVR